MTKDNHTTSYISVAFGALAFLVAILHFWAGPIESQPELETVVAETAVEIRDATIRAIKGEEAPSAKAPSKMSPDEMVTIGVALFGGLAVVLAAIGFIRRENKRAVVVGAALGASAIAFQFVVWMVAVIIVVILVAAVLQNFDGIIG